MVLADVLKRWQQINGKEALLCTGTDEHGMKIQQAAAKEGMPPKEFCDNNASKFKDLAEVANISHDFFIRTTDEDHKSVVEQFWLLLKTRAPEGLGLYKGQHEGWYCVSDECFYPEDLVQPSVVPQTGRKIMASIETGNEVEWVTEDTWFFPLSKYKEKLLKFYDENPDWIQPAHRMNEVRNWVEHHLEDLSITRPASRLSWGIKDPEDPSNTIYVWVDALINYITKAGFGSKWQVDSADKGIWPADVQVVGKDIIRFHAIYWPALLMAVGLPLPKKIVCHNHWTMSNRKMSKSLGNVVNPFFAVQRWNLDPLRYFLMRNGSFKGDMSYANDFIIVAYEKELQANIGNLFNRISRNKTGRWSTLEATEFAREGKFNDIAGLASEGPDLLSLESTLVTAPEKIRNEMDDINLSGALREVFELLRDVSVPKTVLSLLAANVDRPTASSLILPLGRWSRIQVQMLEFVSTGSSTDVPRPYESQASCSSPSCRPRQASCSTASASSQRGAPSSSRQRMLTSSMVSHLFSPKSSEIAARILTPSLTHGRLCSLQYRVLSCQTMRL
jgi:methionyl-tRNA synthetase